MKVSKRKLSILGLLTLVTISYGVCASCKLELREICIISMIAILMVLLLLIARFKAFTGGILYYLCLAFMHCGQIAIIAFNLSFEESRKTSIALGTNLHYSYEAIWFSVLCCLFSAIVICIFERKQKADEDINEEDEKVQISSVGWLAIGCILALVIISDLSRGVKVAAVGYGLGYRQTNTILYYADLLFPLCISLVISVYRDNSRYIMCLFWIVLVRAGLCALFIGSRSEAVLDILICVFAIRKLITNERLKKKIGKTTLIVALVAVIILPFTGLSRNITSLSLSDFLKTTNPITYSLTEFGGTIINVRLGIQWSGSLPISDFFMSFLSILPLSGTILPFLNTTYGNSYSAYLNTLHGGGLGGSAIGEAAFWFGTGAAGIMYMISITMIVVFCINGINKGWKTKGIITSATLLFLLYDLFYMIRGSIASLQGGVKVAIYFWIILFLFKNRLFKHSPKNCE